MLRIKRNKKGATVDNIFFVVMFFGMAIFFLGLMLFWNAAYAEATDLWTGSSIGTEIRDNTQRAVNQFDWILMMLWVGFHLGILVTVYLLRTHPAIFIVAILLTAIIALIAAPLSNAYEDIQGESELATAISSYPMTNFILANFPKLEIIWAIVTTIVSFAFARQEGFI